MQRLDEHNSIWIQQMFQTQDPETATKLFTEEMNKAAKELIKI